VENLVTLLEHVKASTKHFKTSLSTIVWLFIDFSGVENLHFESFLGTQNEGFSFSFSFNELPLCGKCFWGFFL
jgi:hypothetical protein